MVAKGSKVLMYHTLAQHVWVYPTLGHAFIFVDHTGRTESTAGIHLTAFTVAYDGKERLVNDFVPNAPT